MKCIKTRQYQVSSEVYQIGTCIDTRGVGGKLTPESRSTTVLYVSALDGRVRTGVKRGARIL